MLRIRDVLYAVTVIVSSHDVRLHVHARPDGFWERFDSGTWEPWTLRVLAERLRPGARYIDIGAWIGPTVLAAAAAGALVEGFEPDPGALPELRANLDANPRLAQRVTIHPVALAATRASRMLFFWGDAGDSMSSLVHRARSASEGALVNVEPIRDWLGRPAFDAADLIKIDIEGGEYELIPAMHAYLARKRPDLLLSMHAYQLAGQIDRLARSGVPRRIAAHGLVLSERLKIGWLAKDYLHVYVARGNDWQPVDRQTWRRLLHVPEDCDLFFSDQQLRQRSAT